MKYSKIWKLMFFWKISDFTHKVKIAWTFGIEDIKWVYGHPYIFLASYEWEFLMLTSWLFKHELAAHWLTVLSRLLSWAIHAISEKLSGALTNNHSVKNEVFWSESSPLVYSHSPCSLSDNFHGVVEVGSQTSSKFNELSTNIAKGNMEVVAAVGDSTTDLQILSKLDTTFLLK